MHDTPAKDDIDSPHAAAEFVADCSVERCRSEMGELILTLTRGYDETYRLYLSMGRASRSGDQIILKDLNRDETIYST